MDFKVLKIKDTKEWNLILSQVDKYDFYHTPHYHRLDKSGEARLLVFQEKENIIALPLIFRKIENTSFMDVTSVYGYAGWIRSKNVIFDSFEMSQIMTAYFVQEKVISGFSRIHPIIEGANQFPVGEVFFSNHTLGIDLRQSEDLNLRNYSRSVRALIKKQRERGVSLRLINDVSVFHSLYNDAMVRLNADDSLKFNNIYLESLVNSTEYESFILLAELNGVPIGAALFVICDDIMQYHLGAVANSYEKESPLKLLIDEARKIGKVRKLSVLHLGGGYGGKEDGLYIFKSRMSSLEYDFEVWKWIVNEDVYKELSFQKPHSSFFPLYRA